MKKYRFGLGSVLRFRKLQEEQARAAMADAQLEADRATAELEHRLEAIGASLPGPGRRMAAAFQDERDQLDRHMHALRAAQMATDELAAIHHRTGDER